jgi:hypothetical protein
MRSRRLRLQLEALEDRLCLSSSTVVLPISAFLSQQGTTTLLTAPVPDQISWINSAFEPGSTPSDPNRLNMVDYTGVAAQYLAQHGINLHTNIIGFVTETQEVGGLMEVAVNLEVTNALTWVAHVPSADLDTPAINTDPLELGYRAQDLVANPNLTPALSDAHFQITFQEQAGARLPDLFQALILGNAPAGFAPETIDFQSWGTGRLDAGTTVGTPGQSALLTTNEVADFTQPNLPGTLPDGFFQEPVDIVPATAPAASVLDLSGTLFVTDLGHGNDTVRVSATPSGVSVASNLGNGSFGPVTRVVVSLAGGNNNINIGNLPGASVNVSALDGNNNVTVGNDAITVVSLGAGNNNVHLGNASVAQQVFIGGSGNNNVGTGTGANVVLVSGNGNNNIRAAGTNDAIEVVGNGNNNITDTGTGDLITLGGDGNNNIDNEGTGSITDILSGTGHNHVHGVHMYSINTTISAHLTSPTSTAGSIASGLLQGTTQFSAMFTDAQGDYVGTLVITTADGTLTLSDQGNLNPGTGAFFDNLTVTGGTGRFAGATGTLHDQGVLNLQTGTFTDVPLTGVVYIPEQ